MIKGTRTTHIELRKNKPPDKECRAPTQGYRD